MYNVLVVQGDKYGLLLSYFRYYYSGFLIILSQNRTNDWSPIHTDHPVSYANKIVLGVLLV